MQDHLSETQKRSFQYWYIDGLTELALGGVFLLLGLYFYTQAKLPEQSLLKQILNIGFVLVVMGSVYLSRFLISYLKEHLTYPRTGYIAYRRKPGYNRWFGYLVGLGIGALVAGLIIRYPGAERIMPAITGIILSAAFVIFGNRSGLIRFYLQSASSLILGGAFSFLGSGGDLGSSFFFMLLGLVCGLSGGCTLWSYLKKHPAK